MKTISATADMIIKYVLVILFSAMVLIIFGNVFLRFVFLYPLHWSEELSTLLFVWIVFIGAAALQRNEKNIAVELIYSRVSPRAQTIMDLIGRALIIIALIVLVLASIDLVRVQSRAITDNLGWPASVYGTAVLVGSILMLVYSLLNGAKRVRALLRRR